MEWVIRLSHEQLAHKYTYFVTLTYRDEDMILASLVNNRCDDVYTYGILCKKHVQDFLKRLRKNFKLQLKYYFCGEYGKNTFRPHYHGLLFTDKPLSAKDVIGCWKHQDITRNCFDIAINGAAAGYATKYISKRQFLPYWIKDGDKDIHPFQIMSKGIGVSYLEDTHVFDYHRDNSIDTIYFDGLKYSLPRYYRDKIFDGHDEQKNVINAFKSIEVARRQEEIDNMIHESGMKRSDYYSSLFKDEARKEWKKYFNKKEVL